MPAKAPVTCCINCSCARGSIYTECGSSKASIMPLMAPLIKTSGETSRQNSLCTSRKTRKTTWKTSSAAAGGRATLSVRSTTSTSAAKILMGFIRPLLALNIRALPGKSFFTYTSPHAATGKDCSPQIVQTGKYQRWCARLFVYGKILVSWVQKTSTTDWEGAGLWRIAI